MSTGTVDGLLDDVESADPLHSTVHVALNVECLNLLQAFTLLDSIARMTLHAVCRSCHVRLHQATLDTVLDEQPLTEGVQASSLLQVAADACTSRHTCYFGSFKRQGSSLHHFQNTLKIQP